MQGSGPGEGKAFRTRDRVVEWLAANGDIEDSSGMASPHLAEAVGYAGSSVAFAQLLSGMERAGLVKREVRGKRTYRVSLAAQGRARASLLGQPGAGPAPKTGSATRAGRRHGGAAEPAGETGDLDGGPDYDELARRLLVQVARRLLPSAEAEAGAEEEATGLLSSQRHMEALQDKVAALEHELLQAKAARNALEAENDELREQLERIRSNLDQAEARLRPRRQPAAAQALDQSEIALLQRLLANRPPGQLGNRASSA